MTFDYPTEPIALGRQGYWEYAPIGRGALIISPVRTIGAVRRTSCKPAPSCTSTRVIEGIMNFRDTQSNECNSPYCTVSGDLRGLAVELSGQAPPLL